MLQKPGIEEHKMVGTIAHPFRKVLLEGTYIKTPINLNSKFTFNWDVNNPKYVNYFSCILIYKDENLTHIIKTTFYIIEKKY